MIICICLIIRGSKSLRANSFSSLSYLIYNLIAFSYFSFFTPSSPSSFISVFLNGFSSSNAIIPSDIPLKYSSHVYYFKNIFISFIIYSSSSNKHTTNPVILTVFIKTLIAFVKLISLNRRSQTAHSFSFFLYIIVIFKFSMFPTDSIL